MSETLSWPHGRISLSNGVNSKPKSAFKGDCSTVSFPRSRVPVRICYHGSTSGRMGWSRWMAGRETFVSVCDQNRPQALKLERTRWCRDVARSGILSTPSGNNSWLRKFLKRDTPCGDGESQETVVDVHLRLSLPRPKNLADSVSKLAPRWFRSLKGVEPLLLHLSQNGGGGNRDFSMRLGYGGDDDSHRGNNGDFLSNSRLLTFYTRWAAGVAAMLALVWALGHYSGIPQRALYSVPQFVDCVVWLGLAWCSATVLLWAARMVVSFTPASLGYKNGWSLFRSRNAFASGREFVLRSKVDEWMAQNVVVVPGLVISLFLVRDLIHYGTNITKITNVVARIKSQVSRVSEKLNSRAGGATERGGPSPLSRASVEKKERRGTSSPSSKRRRPL